jgi:drug/metabolite transporter (DMT)-like permease
MESEKKEVATPVPAVKSQVSYRWIENGHILLWLLKDTFWAMEWKPGALFMITPTLAVAFYILYRSRHSRQDVFHNIAVCLWISANSLWMAGEFLKREWRPTAVVLFLIGLALLVCYYAFYFRKDMRKEVEEGV